MGTTCEYCPDKERKHIVRTLPTLKLYILVVRTYECRHLPEAIFPFVHYYTISEPHLRFIIRERSFMRTDFIPNLFRILNYLFFFFFFFLLPSYWSAFIFHSWALQSTTTFRYRPTVYFIVFYAPHALIHTFAAVPINKNFDLFAVCLRESK